MAKKKRKLRQKKQQKIKQRKLTKLTKPQKIYKQLENDFYNKQFFEFDTESGEIFEDESYTMYEWAIVEGFFDRLKSFNPDFTSKLKEWINKIIDDYGISATAKMLSDGADAGLIVDKQVVYKVEAQAYYMNQMINYLPDIQQITKTSVKELTDELFFNIENDEFWI